MGLAEPASRLIKRRVMARWFALIVAMALLAMSAAITSESDIAQLAAPAKPAAKKAAAAPAPAPAPAAGKQKVKDEIEKQAEKKKDADDKAAAEALKLKEKKAAKGAKCKS